MVFFRTYIEFIRVYVKFDLHVILNMTPLGNREIHFFKNIPIKFQENWQACVKRTIRINNARIELKIRFYPSISAKDLMAEILKVGCLENFSSKIPFRILMVPRVTI